MAIRYFTKRKQSYSWTDNGPTEVVAINDEHQLDREENRPVAHLSYTPAHLGPNLYTDMGGNQRFVHRQEESGKLFRDIPATVDVLFSDSRMRHTVPTLLGHVLNNAQMFGTTVEASDDLSTDSARIARRAASAGLATSHYRNPNFEPTNEYGVGVGKDIDYKMNQSQIDSMVEIPPEGVKAMRDSSRAALKKMAGKEEPKPKRKRKPKPAPQGEQLRLDI